MKKIHPVALFRLTVLGPLASRERLDYGELKRLVEQPDLFDPGRTIDAHCR